MGFGPIRHYLARYFQNWAGPKPIWLLWRKLASIKSYCEVTQETEPVMIALPDQGMLFRAQNAQSYGRLTPHRASAGTNVWMHSVQGFELVTSKSELFAASFRRRSQIVQTLLSGQVLSNRTEAHLASAAKARSNNCLTSTGKGKRKV